MEDEESLVYLHVDGLLIVHAAIFGLSVDQARTRVLKRHELESVVSRPRTYAHYQDADLELQGAVLAHGIAEGQLFIDGN